jgi:hypothetical protein
MELAAQVFWRKEFITEQHDNSGMRNKDETAKLERKGIILPLLLMPELVSGRHIVR